MKVIPETAEIISHSRTINNIHSNTVSLNSSGIYKTNWETVLGKFTKSKRGKNGHRLGACIAVFISAELPTYHRKTVEDCLSKRERFKKKRERFKKKEKDSKLVASAKSLSKSGPVFSLVGLSS